MTSALAGLITCKSMRLLLRFLVLIFHNNLSISLQSLCKHDCMPERLQHATSMSNKSQSELRHGLTSNINNCLIFLLNFPQVGDFFTNTFIDLSVLPERIPPELGGQVHQRYFGFPSQFPLVQVFHLLIPWFGFFASHYRLGGFFLSIKFQ